MTPLVTPSQVPWYKPGGALEIYYNKLPTQVFFAILLFIALFATDVRDATLGSDSGDTGLEAMLFTILILFSLEIVVCCAVQKGYFNSFFFWMDVIGTVSLIFGTKVVCTQPFSVSRIWPQWSHSQKL